MPFFSVIIPVYNAEKYLKQCIESVLMQSFTDFEVLLINDGSKDASAEICDYYCKKDSRIKAIHKENGGVVSARQAGVENSSGEYIISVDSDDYIGVDLFSRLYDVIVKYNPEIVSYGYTFVNESGDQLSTYQYRLKEGLHTGTDAETIKGKLIYDLSLNFHNYGCMPYSLWSKAIKKELMVKYQMLVPQIIRNGDDMAVTLPAIYEAKSLYVMYYDMYYYRQLKTSIVHSFDVSEVQRLIILIDYLRERIPGIPQECYSAYITHILLGVLIKAAKNMACHSDFIVFAKAECEEMLLSALNDFKQPKLKIIYKLRLWLLKRKMWYVFWLVYRK